MAAGEIVFWAVIGFHGKGETKFIQSRVNGVRYVTFINEQIE